MGKTLEEVYTDITVDPFWDYLRLPGIKFVPGRGQRTKPVAMIVGEAPGATENSREKPFCGPSGQVLDHLMEQAGLRAVEIPFPDDSPPQPRLEANAWITNVVKYRPPHNATPSLGAIEHAKASLRAEWAALGRPPVIICVGSVAHTAIHPEAGALTVSQARHAMFKLNRDNDNPALPWIISSWHPAFGLRKGKAIQDLMNNDWDGIGYMMREMGLL